MTAEASPADTASAGNQTVTSGGRGGVGPRIVALCILARSLALKPPSPSFFQNPSTSRVAN